MNPTQTDPLLLPYLQADDEEEAQVIAARLLREHADPLIHRAVRRKLGAAFSLEGDEVEDVRGEIVLQLFSRLRALRADPNEVPITDFRGYVVTVSYRGCAAFLRARYPLRWRLRNRVRYLLTHEPPFGLWRDPTEEWISGLAAWAGTLDERPLLSAERAHELTAHPLPPAVRDLPDATYKRVSAATQLAAIFRWAARFIVLDDLVTILAYWWGVKDQWHDDEVTAQAARPDPHNKVETQVEQRLKLQMLWQEIQELPLRQRRALLLHLRHEHSWDSLDLFPASRIASLRQIAAALDMPAEELAALWHRLPLGDDEIAAGMNVTRRQVINLRKAARERLLRKLKDW
jgi:DNA-directed RNA polymerase specialized sigma24 family protein